MNQLAQELPTPEHSDTIQRSLEPNTTNKYPLIARNLQKTQYIGVFTLAIAIVAAVGFFSRKVEYAIAVAFILSIVLIAVFLWL